MSISRRRILAASSILFVSPGRAQTNRYQAFDAAMQSIDEDPAAVSDARAFAEYAYRERGPTESELLAQPHLGKVYTSTKPISQRAHELLVHFEVSNRRTYENKYTHPLWPGGQSGLTIGIGYDLGYVSAPDFRSDWSRHLPATVLDSLSDACRMTGDTAGLQAAYVQDVDISWDAAAGQFADFLPCAAGQVVHAFPNSTLLHDDSFGALVSLVYNRGTRMRPFSHDPTDSRREMREIRDLMAAQRFAEIPPKIRAMTRLWSSNPKARGLLRRRQAEAGLFEAGLA